MRASPSLSFEEAGRGSYLSQEKKSKCLLRKHVFAENFCLTLSPFCLYFSVVKDEGSNNENKDLMESFSNNISSFHYCKPTNVNTVRDQHTRI